MAVEFFGSLINIVIGKSLRLPDGRPLTTCSLSLECAIFREDVNGLKECREFLMGTAEKPFTYAAALGHEL